MVPEYLHKSAEEIHTCQPISEQTLENVTYMLQLTDVLPSHPVPLARMEGKALTCNHRDRRVSIVP
jgi:hypothetical protein